MGANDDLKPELDACRRCDLWKKATQGVPGEGPRKSKVMFVGEQPGDQEDRSGRPFVGPAGQLLRRAMDEAGLDPDAAYITNAVKHFKFVERGKKRIHDKANAEQIRACRYWLEAEIRSEHPALIIALGATALSSLVGPSGRVMRDRGKSFPSPFGPPVFVTVHPSSILRSRGDDERRAAYSAFLKDLKRAVKLIR
jgi:uracil-DNA glycosylase family protein